MTVQEIKHRIKELNAKLLVADKEFEEAKTIVDKYPRKIEAITSELSRLRGRFLDALIEE